MEHERSGVLGAPGAPEGTTRRASGRRLRRAVMAALAALGLISPVVIQSATAGALVPVSGVFELEGDLVDDVGALDDWEDLLGGGGSADVTTAIPIFDGADAPTDTSYWKGGGSKDVNDIDRWAYSGTDVAPDKNEIVNAAAAAYFVGPDDELVITFAADRYSNDGDSAIGFWFFKQEVERDGSGGFTGQHTDGDVLVISDFNEGDKDNTVLVFEWAAGNLVPRPLAAAGSYDCIAANVSDQACATQNDDPVSEIAGWDYEPKPNVAVPDVGGVEQYPSHTFLEGAININAVFGAEADKCFASFLAETRSSTSTTAQLKDFVLGSFPICAPSTDLTASTTDGGTAGPEVAVVGDVVNVGFAEVNDGNVELTDVYVDASTDVSGLGCMAGDLGPVATLAAGASTSFDCNVTTPLTPQVITVTGIGHGTDPAGRDTTYCADPASAPDDVVCDADELDTAQIVTIAPSTVLSASALPTTAKQGDPVTFTITETNDGVAPTGYSSYLGLSSVSVTASGADPLLAAACQSGLDTGPTAGDTDADSVLDFGETWTFSCTVNAPANAFGLTFDAAGTVLAGTSYQKTHGSAAGNAIVDLGERSSATVSVVNPNTQMTVTASAAISYTFAEQNLGNDPLAPVGGVHTGILSTDAGMCTADPTYTGGDADNDTMLDPGETWTFTCSGGTLTGPAGDTGSTTTGDVGGNGHGIDSTGDDVTYCAGGVAPNLTTQCDQDERDTVRITIVHNARG